MWTLPNNLVPDISLSIQIKRIRYPIKKNLIHRELILLLLSDVFACLKQLNGLQKASKTKRLKWVNNLNSDTYLFFYLAAFQELRIETDA